MELEVGRCFNTFAEFETFFNDYCKTVGHKYFKSRCTSVQSYNADLKQVSKYLPDALRYKSLKFKCVYHGYKQKTLENVRRRKRSIMALGCPACVGLKANTTKRVMEIVEVNLNHNHGLDPRVDSKRLLTMEQKMRLADLWAGGMPQNQVIRTAQMEYQAIIASRDLRNWRNSRRASMKKQSEQDWLVGILTELKNKDPEAFVSTELGEDGGLNLCLFQTGEMRSLLKRYPGKLHIHSRTDTSFKRTLSIYGFLVEDEHRAKHVVANGVLFGEKDNCLENLCSTLVNANKFLDDSTVLYVVLHQGWFAFSPLENLFPGARVFLDPYYVLQAMSGDVKVLTPEEDHSSVKHILRSLITARGAGDYVKRLLDLEKYPGPFLTMFKTKWQPIPERWVSLYQTEPTEDCTLDELAEYKMFIRSVVKDAKTEGDILASLTTKSTLTLPHPQVSKAARTDTSTCVSNPFSINHDSATNCTALPSAETTALPYEETKAPPCDCSFHQRTKLPCSHIISYYMFEHSSSSNSRQSESELAHVPSAEQGYSGSEQTPSNCFGVDQRYLQASKLLLAFSEHLCELEQDTFGLKLGYLNSLLSSWTGEGSGKTHAGVSERPESPESQEFIDKEPILSEFVDVKAEPLTPPEPVYFESAERETETLIPESDVPTADEYDMEVSTGNLTEDLSDFFS